MKCVNHGRARRVVVTALVISAATVWTMTAAYGQQKESAGATTSTAKSDAAKVDAAKDSSPKKSGGKKEGKAGDGKERSRSQHRLPPHFGDVVSQEQKDKIYSIQDSYAARIKKLQDDMTDLQSKRESEIDAVLTPEQRQRVAELVQNAKSNKKEKSAGEKPSGQASR